MIKLFSFKKWLPYIGTLVLFVVIGVAYFFPDYIEGRILQQGDTLQGIGIGREIQQYKQETGETTRWTSSLFSGMPTYQIAPSYDSLKLFSRIGNIFRLFLPDPAGAVIMMLIGFFIFMKCLKIRTDLAVLGSILWAFSSYFFILIEAGHLWKYFTLAYIPPTIGALMMTYRGERWKGGALFALFVGMQLMSNHVQMTYYFLFVMAALAIAYLVDAFKTKRLADYFKSTGVLVVAGILGVLINVSILYHTYEYSKETIRGQSELEIKAAETATAGGLEKDYITQWSYGVGETATLLVPNAKGGATGALGKDSKSMQKASPEYQEIIAQQNHYWGDQPFTSGPVYVGAFVVFLALLGFLVIRNTVSWALLGTLILTVMLSWGKNFMGLSDLFIDYFPMYNKFRAVSSILVVAEFILPLMAIWMLIEWFKDPKAVFGKKKEIIITLSLTGGLALLMALIPNLFFNFLSDMESEAFLPQAKQNPQLMPILDQMEVVRRSIFTADAWRSVLIITIGVGILFAHYKGWLKERIAIWAIIILSIIDLGGVAKRYLNSDSFVAPTRIKDPFPMSEIDRAILTDTSYYRVYNLATSTFSDSRTSYYHKSIGGYHPAKLRRYQELIDHHLTKNNMAVVNMLNTKYVIIPDQQGQPQLQVNSEALGAAWFVNEIQWVDNADQEIEALNGFDPQKKAIVDRRFENVIANKQVQTVDSTASIRIEKHKANYLAYRSSNSKKGFAVFTEIYYPHGWVLTIDGKETPLVRTNYVLRGAEIPAGEHLIEMRFDPQSIKTTEIIAFASIFIVALSLFFAFWKKKEE